MLARMTFVLLLATCACSSAAPRAPPSAWTDTWTRIVSTDGRYAIAMPAKPRAKRANEGPVVMHLIDCEDEEAVYEIAVFDMPEPLDAGERSLLLDRVQAGLLGPNEARLLKRSDVEMNGVVALQLEIALGDRREGTWRIFYDGDRRMFQISTVGPTSPRLRKGTAAFFASFRLSARKG